MEIQFHGANCVSIGNKQVRIIADDRLASLGQKPVAKAGDILLYTADHEPVAVEPKLLVDAPGEYEVSNISIYGIQARAHMDEAQQKNATMYKLILDDLRILITGHIYPELNERQLEDIGTIDIVIIPVGGNGYTLDSVGALKVIKEIEPKIVIPTHYAEKGLAYEVPQAGLADALKGLGMEAGEPVDSLKLKGLDLDDVTKVIALKRS